MSPEFKTYFDKLPEDRQDYFLNLYSFVSENLNIPYEEKISYGMPTFVSGKLRFHFANFKNHVGIYPGPETIELLSNDLKDYKTSKGAIQFNPSKELPTSLLKKIIETQKRLYL